MAHEFDAVTLEILWKRLISAVDEASAALVRTAFSTVVRESYDFSCVVTDERGRLLAQAQQSIPSFIGTLPRTVRWFLHEFPPDTLEPGDILISNDPWNGTGHLPDINLAKPIFLQGRLVGFAASTAHAPDIGGRTGSHDLRDIFEEGLQIPPMKLMEAGRIDESLMAILRKNVRGPDEVIGDLWAQITGLDVVEQRVLSLMGEYELASLGDLADEIQDRSEQAMRAAIAHVPHGTYRYAFNSDGILGKPVHIEMSMTFDGKDCVIDFEGTSPQVDGAALNCVYAYTYAYTSYGVKAALAPDLPNNDGVWRPIIINVPEGSVLNHRYPTAGGSRSMLGHYLPMGVLQCLAQIIPEKVMAAPGSPVWSMYVAGTEKSQNINANRYFFNGGFGANSKGDGINVLSWPSNISVVACEYMERLVPMRVVHKRLRETDAGAGTFRGGLSQEILFEIRGEGAIDFKFNADRAKTPAQGIAGGADGAVGEIRINGGEPVDTKEPQRLVPGDRLWVRLPSGGGFGDPSGRPAELKERDRDEGYVG